MKESKEKEVEGYFVPSNSTNPRSLLFDNFFDAVDVAVRQVIKEMGLSYDTLDLNKLNVCITKAYVMKRNSKRVCKLVWTSNNLYQFKYYRTVIVNVED